MHRQVVWREPAPEERSRKPPRSAGKVEEPPADAEEADHTEKVRGEPQGVGEGVDVREGVDGGGVEESRTETQVGR